MAKPKTRGLGRTLRSCWTSRGCCSPSRERRRSQVPVLRGAAGAWAAPGRWAASSGPSRCRWRRCPPWGPGAVCLAFSLFLFLDETALLGGLLWRGLACGRGRCGTSLRSLVQGCAHTVNLVLAGLRGPAGRPPCPMMATRTRPLTQRAAPAAAAPGILLPARLPLPVLSWGGRLAGRKSCLWAPSA